MNYPPPNGYEPTDPSPLGAPQQPAYPPTYTPDYSQPEVYSPTAPYEPATGPTTPYAPAPAGPIGTPPAGLVDPYGGYAPPPPPPYQAPPSQGLYGQPPYAPPYAPSVEYQPVPQPAQDGGVAIAVEVIAGLFGFWGIGWLIRGYTTTGVLLLIGGLVFGAIMLVISILTLGVGFLCWGPLNIAAMIGSVVTLSNRMKSGAPRM